jgi:hypothetical protein
MSNLRVDNITDELGTGAPDFPNGISIGATADTATGATHYFVETASDGVIRPKTLANVKNEIVTNSVVSAAGAVMKTGDQTIAGIKTFSNNLSIDNASLYVGDTGAGDILVSNGSVKLFGPGTGIEFNVLSSTGVETTSMLSDYEEGTWTPIVNGTSTAVAPLATGTFTGSYIKVGKMVMLTVSLVNIVTTGLTAANDLFIHGLPYAAASITGTVLFQGSVALSAATVANNPGLSISDNTAYMRISESTTAFDYMIVSEFTSGTADIYGTIMYEAA